MTKIKLFYQGTDEGFCRVDYCTYHDDPEMGIRTRFCLLNDGPDTLDFYLRTDWDEPVDTVDIKNEFIMELPPATSNLNNMAREWILNHPLIRDVELEGQ